MADYKQIVNDPKAVLELASGIGKCIQAIQNANANMAKSLSNYKRTIDDAGFDTIKAYVANAEKKVEDAMPSVEVCMKGLASLAETLQDMRKNRA